MSVPVELPSGWAVAVVGDLTENRVAQAPPAKPVQYVDIGSIDRERKIIEAASTVTAKSAPTRARQWIRKGDVLVSLTRPNLNAVALVTTEHDGAVASTGFDVLRPVAVVPAWLFYRVRSMAFVADVCSSLQGVVYPAVRPADVRRHLLPLPPAAEQQRIVEALDSHFSRLDEIEAWLRRVQRNLKRYRAAVLQGAVEGRLVPTEDELAKAEGRDYEPAPELLKRLLVERRRRWEETELAKMKAAGKPPKDDKWKSKYVEPAAPNAVNLASLPQGWCWASVDMVGDVLLGRQRAPQYLTGRHSRPYLRVANVKDDRLDLSDVETMDFDGAHFAKYQLQPGDILVSEGQSPELLGQSAIYPGGIDDLCFQKTLHRFRPVTGGPTSSFAQLVFRAHVRAGVFRQLGSITTNIAHLTLEKFKAAPFPLPPVTEQHRIVAEVDRLLSDGDEIEQTVALNLERCRRLRQAILKWAFEGKLVDQDPNDEPASVLLDRIRAERASQSASASSPRRRGLRKRSAK